MSKNISKAFLATILLLLAPMAAAENKAGYIVAKTGFSSIAREKIFVKTVLNTDIFVKDFLQTGPASSLTFGLLDGSMHVLGANTRLLIENFVLDTKNPSNSEINLFLYGGSLSSEGGSIGQFNSSQFIVRTPFGEITGIDPAWTILVDNAPGGSGLIIQNNGGPASITINGITTQIPPGTTFQIDADGHVTELPRPPAGFEDIPIVRNQEGADDPLKEPTNTVITEVPGPTLEPFIVPTAAPTPGPTASPQPTVSPTASPSPTPTVAPTATPTATVPPPPPTEPPVSPL
jgi:hypothetical protein